MLSRRHFMAACPTVFLPLVHGKPTVAAGVGTDYVRATDYATLQAAVNAASATAHKHLYAPAGAYTTPQTSGEWAGIYADDLHLFGDGPNKTVLQFPDNLALSGTLSGIRIYGKRVRVEGLSIRGGATPGGAANMYGVSATFGAKDWHLSDIEVAGMYGNGTAGGACFDFYQPSTVDGGYHNGVAERLLAHDSPQACGFVVNSQGSVFRDIRVLNCGDTANRHGVYIQGGGNTFERGYAERSGGWNWHGYAAVPDRAASYNRYITCESVDPLTAHFIATSVNAGASNPDVLPGTPLNRGVVLEGFVFRRTANGPACSGVSINVPGVLSGCVFEDAIGCADAWMGGSGPFTVEDCLFRMTRQPPNPNVIGVVTANGVSVLGSRFVNWLVGPAIRPDGLTRISHNSIDMAGGTGVYMNGPNVTVRDNTFIVRGGTAIGYSGAPTTGADVADNRIV
jgi:hypothetical protein